MQIRNIRKTLVMTVIMLTVMSLSNTVFGVTTITLPSGDIPELTEVLQYASNANGDDKSSTNVEIANGDKTKKVDTVTILSLSGNTLTFDEDAFNQGKEKEANKAMKVFVDRLKDTSISSNTQQEIMTAVQDSDENVAKVMVSIVFSDTKADIFTAYKWLSPLLKILNVILGIGAIIIIVMLIGSTAMDLCYIGLPTWREAQADKGNTGGSGGKRPFGVSWDAIYTVNEVEKNLQKYTNSYVLYFKRRVLTYIVLGICLVYFICGGLAGIIAGILGFGGGFM